MTADLYLDFTEDDASIRAVTQPGWVDIRLIDGTQRVHVLLNGAQLGQLKAALADLDP